MELEDEEVIAIMTGEWGEPIPPTLLNDPEGNYTKYFTWEQATTITRMGSSIRRLTAFVREFHVPFLVGKEKALLDRLVEQYQKQHATRS